MIEESFFQQIIITIFAIMGAIITVILGWYLKKRETCNRIKEQIQKDVRDKVNDIAKTLNDHLKSADKLEKKIYTRIDLLKEKNKLIE